VLLLLLWVLLLSLREVLTTRGMERWEIGDIASKIGQLYYNYYLRTSEIRFLHESYVFYEAIRSRAYFAQVRGPQLLWQPDQLACCMLASLACSHLRSAPSG
jgi:hypothetical protein